MKQFIVLAAILPILLVFVAQATLEGVRGVRMNAAEDAVRSFCVEATYYGGGGPAEAEALRAKLARIFHTEAAEIRIDLSRTDGSHIDWRVTFPVGDIMAGVRLMGLSDAENRGRAQMGGTIVIAPEPDIPPPQEDGHQTETPGEKASDEESMGVGTPDGSEPDPEEPGETIASQDTDTAP